MLMMHVKLFCENHKLFQHQKLPPFEYFDPYGLYRPRPLSACSSSLWVYEPLCSLKKFLATVLTCKVIFTWDSSWGNRLRMVIYDKEISQSINRKFFGKLIKWHFMCPEEKFREKIVWKFFLIFSYFWTLSEKVPDFWWKILGRVVEIAFYVFRGTFWVKSIFSE